MSRSTYQNLKDFINSLEIGDTFGRQDILEFNNRSWSSTIDNYRNYLCQARYLKIVGRGKYQKLQNIPENLSGSKLLKAAYGNRRVMLKDIKDGVKIP